MQACAAFLHKPVHFRVLFLLLDKYFVPHLHHHHCRNNLIYNEFKEKLATLMGGGSLGGGLSPTLNKLVSIINTCTLGKHKKLKLKNKI
jgi:hypothetical protein